MDFVEASRRAIGNHEFRVLDLGPGSEWRDSVAEEYSRLRSETILPITEELFEGIDVLDTTRVRRQILSAELPERRGGNFDVLRSDLGEVLAYVLLAEEYGTQFGYMGVRDRELVALPGRGIDCIGVEVDGVLRLILGEVKVSDDSMTPPRVVDAADDSLYGQHTAHMSDLSVTSKKVTSAARRARSQEAMVGLLLAADRLEVRDFSNLELSCFSCLVRSAGRYEQGDFGTFASEPDSLVPASVRFAIIRTPSAIEDEVDAFAALLRPALEEAE